MTTNNEVKAPRPCTLPWGVTFDFNNFKFCSLRGGLNRNDTLQRVYVKLKDGDTLYSPYYTEEQAWEVYSKVILAIASAQRPWLKTEGFEFVEGKQYVIPYYVAGDEQDGDRILDWYEHQGVFTFKKKVRWGMGEDSEGYSLFHVTRNQFEGYNAVYSGTQYHNEAYDPEYFKPYIPYDPTDTPQQRLAKEQEAWDAVAGVEVYKEVKGCH